MQGERERVLDAVRLLLGGLPETDRRSAVAILSKETRPITTPRAGDVLSTIVAWAPLDGAWTVEDAKRAVSRAGIGRPAKEVYNALGYLTRKGHIRRVGYGQYKTTPDVSPHG